jgi:hypothetical protein
MSYSYQLKPYKYYNGVVGLKARKLSEEEINQIVIDQADKGTPCNYYVNPINTPSL